MFAILFCLAYYEEDLPSSSLLTVRFPEIKILFNITENKYTQYTVIYGIYNEFFLLDLEVRFRCPINNSPTATNAELLLRRASSGRRAGDYQNQYNSHAQVEPNKRVSLQVQ